MNNNINIDYICVASKTDSGLLEYQRLPILKLFDKELQELEVMHDNKNRTVMDLQDYFQKFIPKNDYPSIYNYCVPYKFDEHFIKKAKYPELYTFDEYKTELKNTENSITTEFLYNHKVKNISELKKTEKELLKKMLIDSKEKKIESLKQEFFQSAKRFIQAHRFYKELSLIKKDSRNKMYSTENIGWTTFNYPISNNIVCLLKSNFGYGQSSYFFINITYKGIDILPYSEIIKYYYVNTAEFFRYTRQYKPARENWEVALDFVIETANLAIQDETAFFEKWISNEIKEMVTGLEIISQQPEKCLKNFFNNPQKEINLLYVKNAHKYDKDEYLAFHDEILTIFKAEKISSALVLLDKLQLLASIHTMVLDAIDRIKKLNIALLTNLKECIARIDQEITKRQTILTSKIKERDILKEKWKTHYDKIDELCKNKNYDSTQIYIEYLYAHPDFKLIFENIQKQDKDISNDEYQINKRKNFVKRLRDCKDLITNKLDISI